VTDWASPTGSEGVANRKGFMPRRFRPPVANAPCAPQDPTSTHEDRVASGRTRAVSL
jgi:hypothetical protein